MGLIDNMKLRRTSYVQGATMYPACFAGHHIQGAGAAAAIVAPAVPDPQYIAASCSWTVIYIAYQGLSLPRKQDSPGLDIADYMMGFGLGIVGSITLKIFGVL